MSEEGGTARYVAGDDGVVRATGGPWRRWGFFWLRHPTWTGLIAGALTFGRLLSTGVAPLLATLLSVLTAVVLAVAFGRFLTRLGPSIHQRTSAADETAASIGGGSQPDPGSGGE